MRNKKFFFVLILILIYLAMEIFLPVVAERKIKTGIESQTESIQGLQVDVSTFPAWELLFSRADRVNLSIGSVTVNGLKLDSISARYQNIVLANSEIKGENTDLDVLVTEQALNNYVNKKYPELKDFKIKLNPEQVYLSGYVKIFETDIKLQLTGKFVVDDKNTIVFVPDNLQIEKLSIPASIVKSFVSDMGFSFDLSQLNFPIKVEEIYITSGKLHLRSGIYTKGLS